MPQYISIDSHLEKDGFIDLRFSIVEYGQTQDSVQTLLLKGFCQTQAAGFKVELLPEWKETKIADVVAYKGRVSFVSIGEESDHFVQLLAKLYQIETTSLQMSPQIEFTAITLGGNPMKLQEEGTRVKLFFEPIVGTKDYDNYYVEHFLNIDLPRKVAYFNEKDEAYREAMLRALALPMSSIS